MKPRLLFLCQTLPWPPDAGVSIRSHHIMRLLAGHFDVTALCFYRRGIRPTPELVRESVSVLERFARVEAFPIPQEHSRPRLAWDHVRSIATGRPYTWYAYDAADFSARLDHLLDTGSFDIVHVDSLDLSRYLPLLRGLPVVCTHHNVESSLLQRRADAEPSWPLRRYLGLQAALTEREERRWCARVDLNIVVSPADARELRRLVPRARIEIVPNGVDVDAFRPATTGGRGLVFVGGHGWLPNRDAMEYFGADVLPRIRATHGDIDVVWIGRAPDAEAQRFERRYGIRMTGYVDDIRPHVAAASCYIVPLRIGGGTRLKILDAWALGKAVVSTSIGCEGLDAVDGGNILIADDAAGFADAVSRVLREPDLRNRLGDAARATAERTYDWNVIGRSMAGLYADVLRSRTGSAVSDHAAA